MAARRWVGTTNGVHGSDKGYASLMVASVGVDCLVETNPSIPLFKGCIIGSRINYIALSMRAIATIPDLVSMHVCSSVDRLALLDVHKIQISTLKSANRLICAVIQAMI